MNGIDYQFIGTLTNLDRLLIYDWNRKDSIDMSNFSNLTQLKELVINAPTQLDNIERLSNLTNITSLTIRTGSHLQDIGFASNMINLENLYLQENNISDISPLKNLKKLKNLDIMRNPINTKESETAETLKALRDSGTTINVLETNSTETITFKDEKFKNILLTNYDLNKDNQISVEEMEKITSLQLHSWGDDYGKTITSIDEIVYATNLEHIDISNNIDDISPITKLPNLGSINIDAGIESNVLDNMLNVISRLTKLKHLHISLFDYEGNFKSTEIFSNLNSLQGLYINMPGYDSEGNKRIIDLKGIDKLTELKTLSIGVSTSNFELIKKLSKLEELSIGDGLHNAKGEELSEREILDFIKGLNVSNVRLTGSTEKEFNLGNKLINSTQKVDVSQISEFVKSAITPGDILYGDDLYMEHSLSDSSVQIETPVINLDTSKLGEQYTVVYIRNNNYSTNIKLIWRNYIVGDTSNEIAFQDNKLKEVLLKEHDFDNDKKITEQDMINLQSLDITDKRITSLAGLEKATNLKELMGTGNYIKDITPIMNLEKITNLYLTQNLLTDISKLANVKWTNIEALDFEYNFIDFEKGKTNYNVLEKLYKTVVNNGLDLEQSIANNIKKQYDDDVNTIDNEVTLEQNLKNKLIESRNRYKW